MTDLAIIILGAGGHGRVLADALLASGRRVIGFADTDRTTHGQRFLGIPVLGGEEVLSGYAPKETELANGLSSTSDVSARARLFDRMRVLGYRFATVRHPSAVLSAHATLAEAVQLMASCVVQVGVRLETDVLIDTSASLDHDCRVGAHSHIAPGATLSGSVEVGARTHIGTGASVIQGVRIGSDCIVGAGALVLDNIPDGSLAIGVPARAKRRQ